MPSALLIIGPDGRIIYGNNTVLSLFRATSTDIIDRNPEILFRNDGKSTGIDEYISRARSEKSASGIIDCKRLDRELFSAEIILNPISYEQKPCVMVSLQEKESSDEISYLTRDCPYAILTLNPDLSVVDANPVFSQMSGYSHEQSIQMKLRDFKSAKRDGSTVDEAIQSRKPVGGKIISIFPSGIRHMEYTYIPVFDKDGNLTRIFDIFSDITPLVNQITEYTSLITENPASILTLDPNGRILSVNPSFLAISHISDEKLRSMRIQDFNILQRDDLPLNEIVTSKKASKGRLVADFGWAVKTLDVTYIPVMDANDVVTSLVAMYIDMTDQVTYTEEIQTFIRENPSAIATYNPELCITDLNPAFLTISGYTAEQGISLKMSDFKVLKREGQTITDAIRTKKKTQGKNIIEFPSGIRHVEYSYIPILNKKGEVIRIFQIFSDITELEEKITESETLVSENPASILSLDPKGKILSVNPSFLAISHLTEEKLLSMSMQDFNLLRREGLPLNEIVASKKASKGRLVADFGWAVKTLDVTYIPVMDANAVVTSLTAMYIDVTEQVAKIEEIEAFIRENPHSIMTLSPDLSVMDVNPAFCEISGYTHEQAIHMKHQEFKSKNRDGASAHDAIKNKKPMGGKIICLFPAGVRHMEYTYLPIFDLKGNLVKVFDIFADRTGLVDQISESEMLVSNNPASLITSDLQGNILAVNQAFIDISQIPESKLLTMKIQGFNITKREGTAFEEVITSKKVGTGTLTVDFGRFFKIFNYTYIPILDVNGNMKKVVTMYMDITAIQSMIKYLEQSVKMIHDNISSLARGDTKFTTTILDADENTASAREQFVMIGEAIDTARKSIASLVDDSGAIATAALAGDLKFRTDASVHQGDYRAIIEGLNKTLDSITTPINESMRIANKYATYDFTIRFDPTIPIKGDWIAFREALNGIGDQVGEAIAKINNEVTNLSANAEEAHASAQEIANGANLMAKNAGRVSTNAEEGNTGSRQILKAMEDLTVTIGEVSKKTEEVSTATQNANSLAKKGSDMAKRAEDGMNVITSSTVDMNRLIGEIQKEMDQIGKIVGLIKDIASQTNLLALNAAIEAARAGEAGRGFAVVAAEVKSLAQESRSSAENIAEMIGSLQIKSANAGKSAELTTEAVTGGSAALGETLMTFSELARSVEEISGNIEQVASMTEEQAASSEEIAASVQEVSGLLEGTSKEAVEMAGITEETAASLDQLKTIIQNVNSITETVSGAVTRFKV